ncbi:hypothetical protein GGX14DRAFT_596597 [Mycena pura]|uniref:NADH:flavin oxidoreductase/NADH oxidase N-terminal domain-containing protein n=1 Tax=Mycena pura TaxID=153505 RepID=A0AAD6UTF4_9AGAR|nr:hypothetical protein GGX14DRAFT_596597 [Mycena pura]
MHGEQPILFKLLDIKGVTFKNRVFTSPMCQYSSDNGHATGWHLVLLGASGFATHSVGAICMESTVVVPEGRISRRRTMISARGLWTDLDSQMAPLKRIVEFCHSHGTKVGMQLAHAGRKASTYAPWLKDKMGHGTSWVAQADENGWPDDTYAPSAISFSDGTYPHPKAMTEEDVKYIEDAYVAATKRCLGIGFDFLEIHCAHGYYGGSLENRLRFPTRILQRVRDVWADKPLLVRISATDWKEGPEKADDGTWLQWGVEQSIIWTEHMLRSRLGVVDLLDVSSAGNWFKQEIPDPVKFGYQIEFAAAIKKAHPPLIVGGVGMIIDPEIAEGYLKDGKADVVFLARELLRNRCEEARMLGQTCQPI